MNQTNTDNLFIANPSCSICKELLDKLHQFFDMLSNAGRYNNDWLTVEDVAKELKISKSIVYRLIRNGELGAVNIVENEGKISLKGHYRIKRQSLENYLEQKKVKSLPAKPSRSNQPKNLRQVKNHLGL